MKDIAIDDRQFRPNDNVCIDETDELRRSLYTSVGYLSAIHPNHERCDRQDRLAYENYKKLTIEVEEFFS